MVVFCNQRLGFAEAEVMYDTSRSVIYLGACDDAYDLAPRSAP